MLNVLATLINMTSTVYTNQHYQMASTKSLTWLRNEEPIRISSDQLDFELNAQ